MPVNRADKRSASSRPAPLSAAPGIDLEQVAARVERNLAAAAWGRDWPSSVSADPAARRGSDAFDADAAAEVAAFAMRLGGKRRAGSRGGRLSRLVAHFALAAIVGLTAATAGCESDSGPDTVDVQSLPSAPGSAATVAASPQTDQARFTDLVLIDPGGGSRWALMAPRSALAGDVSTVQPVLVDNDGANLQTPGAVYTVPALPIGVGTRDGPSQYLDPLDSAILGDGRYSGDVAQLDQRLLDRWRTDERFAAAVRSIEARPSVLDAAYNAEAASAAGGTHTYADGVVLRVDPDNPVLQVVDRGLLESGKPLRPEDVVYVAVRSGERSLYEPGTVVTLRDVVMDRQQTTDNGQTQTFYVANAALEGARVEPTGQVDLQANLQQRLQRTDADLAIQAQELGAEASPTALPTLTARAGQPVVVNSYRGPSFVDDLLIYWWLSNSGWYRGPSYTVTTPPSNPTRPTGDYYYVPPPSGSSSTTASGGAQTASRSEALQAARNAVSGQAAGTGGGTAATTKAASEASARVSAATNKAASVAGQVSSSSAGKSISSVASNPSSPAARSSGTAASSARSSAGAAKSGGASVGRGTSGGFGGKGISGGGAS